MDKQFEWYIHDNSSNNSFPIYVEKPGFFIGSIQLLSKTKQKTFISSSIMSCSAGSKSAFTLSNIGNQRNHLYLQRKFGISHGAPKDIHQHWDIFKEIASLDNQWQAKIVVFSEEWVRNLRFNPEWIPIQKYLIEKMVRHWEQDKNYFFYNYAFSKAQTEKNIIKNPYLNETAKHILGIPLGINLGFQPCEDEQPLPLGILQSAYKDIYQLKDYPTFLSPAKFDIDSKTQKPIYYSLQKPIICSLEKQTKTEPRVLANMHTLQGMIKKYLQAFNSNTARSDYSGTSLQEMTRDINFSFFHHSPGDIGLIKPSSLIPNLDTRFITNAEGKTRCFSSDTKFFRGCIMVSH